METTTHLDYMAILKSVAKVEDDKYEYMVSADAAIEAMKLAVEESQKMALNLRAENSRFNPMPVNDMENEIWKDIDGWEGYYQISILGRVKSIARDRGNGRNKKDRILRNRSTKKGYQAVILCRPEYRKTILLHRLVATAFISNPDNKPYINHINGIKVDNRIENLEWCTSKENIQHSFKTGLTVPKRGAERYNSKGVLNTSTGKVYGSITEAFEDSGMSSPAYFRGMVAGRSKNKTKFILLDTNTLRP